MNFVSLAFIIFLISTFIIYFITPKKYEWIVLLIASFIFYIWANWYFALYLLASIIVTYTAAILIAKYDDEKKKNWILAASIFINIGILFVVKYLNFTIATAVGVLNKFSLDVVFNGLNILLPIGLSFYTFQSIAYVVDVKREMIEPQRNIFKYALFVSFFPQILQGPIGRYETLAPQLYEGHDFSYENFFKGAQRIILGFFKKIVVADFVGLFVNTVFANPDKAYGFVGVFGAIGYAIQLYADFSGFMDIAIGTSKVLGIELDENFNTPYLSKSIAEYWRRWHITLGAFFRDYVYYPILRTKTSKKLLTLKNRKLGKNIATLISLLITWALIGIWHGANWTYLLHGLYYGVIISSSILLEPIYKKVNDKIKIKDNIKDIFRIIRTFIIVCFGYILFRSESLQAFGTYLSSMFSGSGFYELQNFKEVFNAEFELTMFYVIQIVLTCCIWSIQVHQFRLMQKEDFYALKVDVWKKKIVFLSAIMVITIIAAYILYNSIGGHQVGFIYYEF